MMLRHLAVVAWLLVSLFGNAGAHEVRPGYLELRQTGAQAWSMLWKVPAAGEMRLSIHPRFPANCRITGKSIMLRTSDAHVERATMACRGGLDGGEIRIDGLAATMTDVLVRSVRADGSTQVALLSPSAAAFVFEAAPESLQVARAYTVMGVEHILGGVDHLLFVLGLLLLLDATWPLAKAITAFTVAHSMTLAASTLGWLGVEQAPVEAVIALSLLFVAGELARQSGGGDGGLMQRFPWMVAFTFGLLHGLGFAGALRDIGLPQSAIPLALFTFNIGVEIGQLLFVGIVLLASGARRRLGLRFPAWTAVAPAYAIGTMATYWALQRIAPLF